MAKNNNKEGKGLLMGILAIVVLVLCGYGGAIAWFSPEESKMVAWQSDLDAALAEAKKTEGLVLVKAGSKW